MRKRLSTIMAIVMALGMVFMAAPALAANGTTGEDVVMTGSVPWAHQWTVADSGDKDTVFTSVTAAEYDAVNGIPFQEAGISRIEHTNPLHHLTSDNFYMLVINTHTLQSVNLLYFINQVFLYFTGT